MKSISITKSIFILFLFIAIGCTGNQKKSQESNLVNETSTETANAQYVGEYSFENEEESGNVSISLKEGNILSFNLYIDYRGNSGEISGEVEIVDGKGVFTTDEYGDCILNFVFTDNSVHISHEEGGYECGFGMNVAANNTFFKESKDASLLTTEVMDRYLITKKSVGEFKFGQEINLPYQSDVCTIEREVVNGWVEGEEYVSVEYHVFENGEEVMTLLALHDDPSSNTIYEARILSEDYKTKEGIGVNSTIEDYMKCYPDYRIWWAYMSNEYIIDSETAGSNVEFVLDPEGLISTPEIDPNGITLLKYSDFKKNTKIRDIFVSSYFD